MPFSCQFRLFFLPFPPLGSVYGSVHRTTGSAEPPNLTEPVVLPNLPNRTFGLTLGERFQILGRDFRSSLKRTYDEKDHIWEVRKKELLSWSHEIWRTIQVEKIMQLNMACQDFLAYWKVMVNKFTAAATTLGFIFEEYLKGNLLVDLVSAYLHMHNT